jgi:hypothetical protein
MKLLPKARHAPLRRGPPLTRRRSQQSAVLPLGEFQVKTRGGLPRRAVQRLRGNRWSGAMSDCLHCDINELVRERIEGTNEVDLVDMIAKVSQSLADLIMLAPKEEWAGLLAEAIRHLGDTFLAENQTSGSDTAH